MDLQSRMDLQSHCASCCCPIPPAKQATNIHPKIAASKNGCFQKWLLPKMAVRKIQPAVKIKRVQKWLLPKVAVRNISTRGEIQVPFSEAAIFGGSHFRRQPFSEACLQISIAPKNGCLHNDVPLYWVSECLTQACTTRLATTCSI